jgi:mannitol 2-dehydrogenase
LCASWARYAEGADEQGQPIDIVDRLAPTLTELAHNGGTAFIENRTLFGDLADNDRFRETYLRTLNRLHEVGARATLEELVARDHL